VADEGRPASIAAAERRLIPEGRLSGPMPWVLAIMTFLTILAAAAALSLSLAARDVRAELAGGMTIQIVEANPDQKERQTEDVLAYLADVDGLMSVRRIPDEELERMLSPWLGSEGIDEDIPIPAMIDVRTREGSGASAVRDIRQAVTSIAPSARVDAHANWLTPVFDLLRSLQWLALGLIALLATATAASVLLSANSALGTHRATIDIVHMLGATDRQITRLFQRRMALDAAFGGLLGLILAAAAIWLITAQIDRVGSEFLSAGKLGILEWALLILVPIATSVLALFTARMAIMRALRKIL
jgi:cell division transport system permease protein